MQTMIPLSSPVSVRLAELAVSLPLSRASVFEIVKALGIRTIKGAGPEGRGRVSWVTSTEAEQITTAAHSVHRGEVRIADLDGPTPIRRQLNQQAPAGYVSQRHLEERWAITRNAVRARAEALGVEVLRVSSTLTAWPLDAVPLGDRLHSHLRSGGTLAGFDEAAPARPAMGQRVNVLADLLLEALQSDQPAAAEADRLGWPALLLEQLGR